MRLVVIKIKSDTIIKIDAKERSIAKGLDAGFQVNASIGSNIFETKGSKTWDAKTPIGRVD